MFYLGARSLGNVSPVIELLGLKPVSGTSSNGDEPGLRAQDLIACLSYLEVIFTNPIQSRGTFTSTT